MRSFSRLAAVLLWGFLPAVAPVSCAAGDEALTRIALGSCADQELPQPIWDAILATDPQLFLFLGDNIYSDTYDMGKMKADYEKLASIPEFRRFRSRVPILATWDDHDYGVNDGGAEYPKKEEAKQLFLDFFEEPADSPRRRHAGIYTAKVFGPPGRRVQIVLLDGRSFRSPIRLSPSPYRRYRPETDPSTTMLGEAQWAWLENELEKPAELRLIASGVQVLGYAAGFESWKNFPHEQERLFRVIRETGVDGVVFLTGDAHFTQIKRGDGGVGYPLYEFSSSGLTHSRPEAAARPSPLAVYRPYGGLNFGTITIDWEEDDPEVTLAARDRDGAEVFVHRLRLSELRGSREVID